MVWQPGDTLVLVGLIFPKYNECRVVGDKDGFTCSWFDYNKFPYGVSDELKLLKFNINMFCQSQNIVPKQWPDGLNIEPTEFPLIFEFTKISIINHNWFGTKESSTVDITVRSTWFEPMTSTVKLPPDIVDTKCLFNTLQYMIGE